ncbi:MAG: hypothetical protein ABSF26_12225 [Thermoguttaceae bacterium]|jgi:hypothetical protein
MDTQQIDTALARLFNEDGHRIVLWNDPEREFINTMLSVPISHLQGA